MVTLPDWITAELQPFASGERPWDVWGNWLAMSAARASRDIPADWFARIKANPQVEVIQLLAAAGVTTTPHAQQTLVSHPLDSHPHFTAVMALADELTAAEVGDSASEMGGCHRFWSTKKQILKSRFGLDWESPADLNPDVFFD